ncbi:hypothetical protein BDV96DRAFT_579792 [Lophiotrema nucula]|uniref:Uncharacterized protein n=1 Tax=Lophiotrema nucula TaxID=690887 RepID=A0A6A5Z127_9PLEO|nr:hypothetical protein BDV96DRAFT_579792 [Lophiotrema nucula]
MEVLPPEVNGRPEYRRCRTTYGMLLTAHQNAEIFEDPIAQYKEMQKLEPTLRQHLNDMKSRKGAPARMTNALNELKPTLVEVIELGPDAITMSSSSKVDDMTPVMSSMRLSTRPPPEKMVPESKVKKARRNSWTRRRRISD